MCGSCPTPVGHHPHMGLNTHVLLVGTGPGRSLPFSAEKAGKRESYPCDSSGVMDLFDSRMRPPRCSNAAQSC